MASVKPEVEEHARKLKLKAEICFLAGEVCEKRLELYRELGNLLRHTAEVELQTDEIILEG